MEEKLGGRGGTAHAPFRAMGLHEIIVLAGLFCGWRYTMTLFFQCGGVSVATLRVRLTFGGEIGRMGFEVLTHCCGDNCLGYCLVYCI